MAASNKKTKTKTKKLSEYGLNDYSLFCLLKKKKKEVPMGPHKFKNKIVMLYDPAIPLLGIYPKELKAESQRDLYTHVHSSIIHNSEKMEAT